MEATDQEDKTLGEAHAEVLEILGGIGYEGLTEAGREQREHVMAKLMTTKWDELAAVEYEEQLMFPEVLTHRKSDGTWHEIKIRLRVPRDHDLRQARVEARAMAIKQQLSLEHDKDLIENLENVCILARCICSEDAPYAPEFDVKELDKKFDKVVLQLMWAKLDKLSAVLNPAPDQLSSTEIVALIVAIGRARHLGPLVVYGPGAQNSFVVSMVDLLLNLVGSKLSSASLERLMQAS